MFLFSKPLSVLVSNSETSWAAIAALAPCVLIICMISAYPRLLPGPEQHGPDVRQPDLRGHHPPRHRPEPRLAAHARDRQRDLCRRRRHPRRHGRQLRVHGLSARQVPSVFENFAGSGRHGEVDARHHERTARHRDSHHARRSRTPDHQPCRCLHLHAPSLRRAGLYGHAGRYAERHLYLPADHLRPPVFFHHHDHNLLHPGHHRRAHAQGRRRGQGDEESAIRTIALIALPCAIGLAVMAEPIIRLLCPGYSETSGTAVATPILQVFGIAVICNSMVCCSTRSCRPTAT